MFIFITAKIVQATHIQVSEYGKRVKRKLRRTFVHKRQVHVIQQHNHKLFLYRVTAWMRIILHKKLNTNRDSKPLWVHLCL